MHRVRAYTFDFCSFLSHCPGPITFISLQSTTKVEKNFRASPAGGGKLSFLGGIPPSQEMSR